MLLAVSMHGMYYFRDRTGVLLAPCLYGMRAPCLCAMRACIVTN